MRLLAFCVRQRTHYGVERDSLRKLTPIYTRLDDTRRHAHHTDIVWHVLDDDGACTDDRVGANRQAINDRCADADISAAPDRAAPGDVCPRPDCRETTNPRMVAHRSRSVDDNVFTDVCMCGQDRIDAEDRAGANGTGCGAVARRMDQRRKLSTVGCDMFYISFATSGSNATEELA